MKSGPIQLVAATGPLAKVFGDKADEVIEGLNKVLTLKVVIVNNGASSMVVGGEIATLTISTKDINLGAISGSKGANAALASLMTALAATFTVRDITT